MKKMMIAVLFMLSATLGHATESETVKGAKKDYEKFKIEMQEKLVAADKKIDELKAKAKAKSSDAEDKAIKDLEESRADLSKKLEEMQKSGESGWKKAKRKFANSVDKLNKKIQKSLEE